MTCSMASVSRADSDAITCNSHSEEDSHTGTALVNMGSPTYNLAAEPGLTLELRIIVVDPDDLSP